MNFTFAYLGKVLSCLWVMLSFSEFEFKWSVHVSELRIMKSHRTTPNMAIHTEIIIAMHSMIQIKQYRAVCSTMQGIML